MDLEEPKPSTFKCLKLKLAIKYSQIFNSATFEPLKPESECAQAQTRILDTHTQVLNDYYLSIK